MHARLALLFLGSSLFAACGSDETPPPTSPGTVILTGDAIPFSDGPDGRIEDAAVSILELPERSLVTKEDGKFSFYELKPGAEITLRMQAPGFAKIQTGTITIPDRALVQTSDDGGVLFVNVPPGTYTLTGTKAGAVFTTLKMKCEAGWLVNASPPWGLQRL